jgi:hypothetical protein
MHILIDFQVAPSWGQVGLTILVSNHPIISIELKLFAFTLYHTIKLGCGMMMGVSFCPHVHEGCGFRV